MEKYRLIAGIYEEFFQDALNNAHIEGYILHTLDLLNLRALMVLPAFKEKLS